VPLGGFRELARGALKTAAATACMAGAAWGVLAALSPGTGLGLKAARVLLPAAAGAAAFTAVAAALGSVEMQALWQSVRRRRRAAAPVEADEAAGETDAPA
jgi:hypothetical protein